MNRREQREAAFMLLFEREFNSDISALEFYQTEIENREYEDTDYIRHVFFGVEKEKARLDEQADKYFRNWKRNRISAVSASIIRLAGYEMNFMEDIPRNVSINEGIELSKKFDEDKAKNFVNGVLNAIAKELDEKDE